MSLPFTSLYTVYRRDGDVTYGRDGLAILPAETSFTVQGNLQPLSQSELQRLPEGWRVRARWWFACKESLRAGHPNGGILPDEVEVDGERYQVEGVDDYTNALPGSSLNHCECYLAVREVPQ